MCKVTYYVFANCSHSSPKNPYLPGTFRKPPPRPDRRTSNGQSFNNGPPLPDPLPDKPDPRPFQYMSDVWAPPSPSLTVLPSTPSTPPTPPPKEEATSPSSSSSSSKCHTAIDKCTGLYKRLTSNGEGVTRDENGATISRCWWKPTSPQKHCKVERVEVRLPGKCKHCTKHDETLFYLMGRHPLRSAVAERELLLQERAARDMTTSESSEDLAEGGPWI